MTFVEEEPAEWGWSNAWSADPGAGEVVADEVASLGWSYVSRLSRDRRPIEILDRLANLSSRDSHFLRRLHFVESREAKDLLSRISQRLRRLPQSTKPTRVVGREAKGRIDWPRTLRERMARGGDPTIIAVANADRHFNVSGNRALVYLLDRLVEMARSVSQRPDGKAISGRASAALVGAAAARLRSTSALATVPSPENISGIDRQALRASRLPEFRNEVASLLKLYDSLFIEDDLSELRRLLGERVWLPLEPERLFELWVLFTAVRTLEGSGWVVQSLRLLGAFSGGAGPTFRVSKGGTEVAISYQSLPPELLESSRYTPLLGVYGIAGSVRRPDFVITAETNGKISRMLVEVKLTGDRAYITDSIYKVFGYLADFASSLGLPPPTHAVLIVWAGIVASRAAHSDDEIVILDAQAVRNGALVQLVEQLSTLSNKN